MEVALEMHDIFLIVDAGVDLADIWEDFVVGELALGQAEHHYDLTD